MISNFVSEVRKSNRLIAGGMFFFDSPGHMLSETDYLIRLARHDPAIRERTPIVLLPPSPMSTVIAEILKVLQFQVFLDQNAAGILREIQLFHPDLIVDVGQAHWKLVVADKSNRGCGDLHPLNFGWALRQDEFVAQIIRMHGAWNATRGQLPLRDGVTRLPVDPEFLSRLKAKKYAVLQIKAVTGNGTVRLLPGDVYRPTLARLKDEGYAIILAGREPMLEEFARFDVFDYPRSRFVCPRNDFFLFSHAALGIVSPSGAGLFCDTLGIPCCQIGSWTLIPHPSEKTLMVPSRFRERASARVLSFSQQAEAVRNMYDPVLGPAPFDSKTYEDIPPSADEILQGVEEALHRGGAADERARAQANALRAADPTGMWQAAASRMSPSFLTKHPEYLS